MKLSRPTVIAFNEFKRIVYGDPNIKITSGYVLGAAYNLIKEEIDDIDWNKVNKKENQIVDNSLDKSITNIHTTLNIESSVLEGINKLQERLLSDPQAKRIHKSFVVKLVMFAALLKSIDDLPKIEIDD